jgi:hypothetical protein
MTVEEYALSSQRRRGLTPELSHDERVLAFHCRQEASLRSHLRQDSSQKVCALPTVLSMGIVTDAGDGYELGECV